MSVVQHVKDYWDQQASEVAGPAATSPDLYYRDYEIRRVNPWLVGAKHVLDVGCGNGYSTARWAEERPETSFVGIDYSERMIDEAHAERSAPNLTFHVDDVRHLQRIYGANLIVSERCLINLADWREQQEALKGLVNILARHDRLILVENTRDGLDMLNKVRKKFGLAKIEQRWHNHYFDKAQLVRFFHSNGLRIEYQENIGNLYYLVSRVLHAALADSIGQEPRYDHILNKLAAELPPIDGPYSPNMMWVLQKT